MILCLPRSQYYYASHYPQSSYGHYHQYTPQQTAQTAQPAQTSQSTQPLHTQTALTRQNTQTNSVDTADIATLNDALGSAGVDLRVSYCMEIFELSQS